MDPTRHIRLQYPTLAGNGFKYQKLARNANPPTRRMTMSCSEPMQTYSDVSRHGHVFLMFPCALMMRNLFFILAMFMNTLCDVYVFILGCMCEQNNQDASYPIVCGWVQDASRDVAESWNKMVVSVKATFARDRLFGTKPALSMTDVNRRMCAMRKLNWVRM